MAAIPITIIGTSTDSDGTKNVTIVGLASITGLEVGGGPIIPPTPGKPPGIWGGANEPFPTPPIANVPGIDNPNPPGWGEKPPEPVQPPIEWKAVWHPTEGWVVVGIPQFPHPAPSA